VRPENKSAGKGSGTCSAPKTGDRGRGSYGFTIIEVMVSIMILAVSVVSIFGAQFATIATVGFSRYTTQAMELARCRMSEIELEVQVENGFEEGDITAGGECCEMIESDTKEFTCSWEIKTLEIPDILSLMAGGQDGGVGMIEDFGVGDSADDMGMMGAAMSFLPMLSDMLGQAIRRVTVKVEWTQGIRKRDFVLSQYLVHPTQGPLQLMNTAADALDREEIIDDATNRPFPGLGMPGGAGKK
jgi:prepilin-type N-terminal cleavage/methylation domain-containing protein